MSMDIEKKIRDRYPSLEWEKTIKIEDGWDHDVLLLDDRYVARIPKNDGAKTRAAIDFSLLALLEKKVSASIPHPIAQDTETEIVIYSFVSGIQISESIYKNFHLHEKKSFERNISTFLDEIHHVPVEEVQACAVPEKTTEHHLEELRKDTDFIQPFLSPQEKERVTSFMSKRESLLSKKYQTLIHGDLTAENIFIKKDEPDYLGIIDFSDAVISDPAKDISALFAFGEGCVQAVLKHYPTKDVNMYERALAYYQDMAITLFALAYRNSTFITKPEAKQVLTERFKIKTA